jgi:hypothetical protein
VQYIENKIDKPIGPTCAEVILQRAEIRMTGFRRYNDLTVEDQLRGR